MDDRKAALSLLFAVVLAAGCVSSGNGDTPTGSVTVQELQVTPNEIYEGSSTRVRMEVENTGGIKSTLKMGEDGGKILTDYCSDMFNLKNFQSTSGSNPSTSQEYELEPGEKATLNWELQQEGKIPLQGYNCPMKFRLPFDYSVDAFQQIQIKESDEAGGNPELAGRSSTGPLEMYIEAIGSSSESGSPVFLEGDDIEVLLQLNNKEPSEKGLYSGFIEAGSPKIEGESINLDCEDVEEIRLYEGKSQVIRCNSDYSLKGASMTSEVRASLDYSYIKDLGERNVKVRYGGD